MFTYILFLIIQFITRPAAWKTVSVENEISQAWR